MNYKILIEFTTEAEKLKFKDEVKGENGIAFDTNKIYMIETEQLLTVIPFRNEIIEETETSILYYFERQISLPSEFYFSLNDVNKNNAYTIWIKKARHEYITGGMLKGKLTFGNFDVLNEYPNQMIQVDDFTPQILRREIKRVEKVLKEGDYDITFMFILVEWLNMYYNYNGGYEDKYKPTFFYKLYTNITNEFCKEMVHENFYPLLRKGKLKNL